MPSRLSHRSAITSPCIVVNGFRLSRHVLGTPENTGCLSTAPNFMTLHFSVLKLRSHCSDQLSSVSKFLWKAQCLLDYSEFFPYLGIIGKQLD